MPINRLVSFVGVSFSLCSWLRIGPRGPTDREEENTRSTTENRSATMRFSHRMSVPICPHCYRRVIPAADGFCPACGKNTNDRANTDPHRTLVGLQSGASLPPICHHCGAPTQSIKKLTVVSEPEGTAFANGLGQLLAHLFKPFGFIVKIERLNKTTELTLQLPTCEQCARIARRITPHYIDFDAHRIDLIVHTGFKQALDKNAPS